MHDQAVLTLSHPQLGSAGSVISIDTVEKFFPDSATANAAAEFHCMQSNCGVTVKAVLVRKNVVHRKKSPSSYFKAGRSGHSLLCGRTPSALASQPSSGTQPSLPASPNKATYPSIWVDPRKTAAGPNAPTAAEPGSKNNVSNSTSSSHSSSGNGQSSSSSKRLQKYAEAWLKMPNSEKKIAPLLAPWNAGSTYFSGFYPLAYYQKLDVEKAGERIFVGIALGITTSGTGVAIQLREKSGAGGQLMIWIDAHTYGQHGRAGAELQKTLSAGTNDPNLLIGKRIFALGSFHPLQVPKGQRLSINHPDLIWIES